MRRRLSLLIGDRKYMIAIIGVTSLVAGIIEASTLALVAEIAFSLAGGSKHGHATHTKLTLLNFHYPTGTLILIAFALCGLRLVVQLPLSFFSARVTADVQTRLRIELFEAFNRASWAIQSQDREGQLQETMTGQAVQAISGAIGCITLITTSIQFAVLLTAAFFLNAIAALSVGVMTAVMFGVLRPMRARGGRYSRELSKAQVAYASAIAESNRVAEESHVFGAGGAQRKKISGHVNRARHWFFRAQLLGRLVTNVYQTLIYILLVAGLGIFWLVGGSHPGSLAGVVLVLLRAGTAGQGLQSSWQSLIQAIPFIERTQLALERYRENAEYYGELPLPSIQTIAFEKVSFAYNRDVPVLQEVSFEVSRGEAIGIVGPSGAGKSTLVQLLLRLRDPVDGRYLINGQAAQEFTAEDWHRQVSYVPQEPRLLHASVEDNIRFFREIDDESLERAAKLARIHDDIVSWGGYTTTVGPRADAVSGGQQQRICLARALAAQPEILILDEPTSALDPQSEAMISASLLAMRSDLTLFVVAHRMSTLEMCDRVMVILDGRLVGFDTKAALQEHNDYYRHASELSMIGSGS
jgi:ABC-type multidrug transport system fused ATPase/permease subunit